MVQDRQVRKLHMLKTRGETLEAAASKSGMDEHRCQPGLWGTEGGRAEAGAGEGPCSPKSLRAGGSLRVILFVVRQCL